MHPALSVIFFTVTAGLGYGVVMLLVLVERFGLGGAMTTNEFLVSAVIGLVAITAGLLSSTLHLANPKNAWRAFFRFRTSWLSREGVFAVVFYPFALAYFAGVYWAWPEWLVGAFAVATFALAFVTVYSTGMIYACLRTIRQWNNSLTPTNYLLLSLAAGALLVLTLRASYGAEVIALGAVAIGLLATAAATKVIYYIWIGRPEGSTINTATGFTMARVRLLDVGHSAGTFLTDEFDYQVSRETILRRRALSLILGFAIPIALVATVIALVVLDGPQGLAVGLLPVALVSHYLGVAVERWLFFAEARHVVNLYHGYQRA